MSMHNQFGKSNVDDQINNNATDQANVNTAGGKFLEINAPSIGDGFSTWQVIAIVVVTCLLLFCYYKCCTGNAFCPKLGRKIERRLNLDSEDEDVERGERNSRVKSNKVPNRRTGPRKKPQKPRQRTTSSSSDSEKEQATQQKADTAKICRLLDSMNKKLSAQNTMMLKEDDKLQTTLQDICASVERTFDYHSKHQSMVEELDQKLTNLSSGAGRFEISRVGPPEHSSSPNRSRSGSMKSYSNIQDIKRQ